MPENTSAPEGTTSSVPAPSRRPAALRLLGVLLAVLAVLTGVGTASASPAVHAHAVHHQVKNKPLTGVWDLIVTVHLPDGTSSVTDPRFTFTPDHKLTAEGPPDASGDPLYAATGYWNESADGSIALYITHGGASEGGAIPGTVQAEHIGKIKGKHFSTDAYAFVFTAPGAAPEGPIHVDSTATWVSPVPAA
ncbi:hypothetical protein ACIQU5_32945 [Streptomyces sp. NPDC090306]|uniref:hypothetical protein n=1 Tax=unclassified Streptomyces TaxID=2593676 RepID=UPI0036E1EEC1